MTTINAWLPLVGSGVLVGTLVWRLSAMLNELHRDLRMLRGQYEALAVELEHVRGLLLMSLRPPGPPVIGP